MLVMEMDLDLPALCFRLFGTAYLACVFIPLESFTVFTAPEIELAECSPDL